MILIHCYGTQTPKSQVTQLRKLADVRCDSSIHVLFRILTVSVEREKARDIVLYRAAVDTISRCFLDEPMLGFCECRWRTPVVY